MTDEHQDIQDNDCRILDEELSQQVEQTDQSEQIDAEDRVQEVEIAEPEDVAEQPEQAEPEDDTEETQEVGSPAESEQVEAPQQDQDAEITVESVVEAVLFASDEPLSAARLANIVETDTKQVRQHVKNLNEKYQANNSAFRIEQIAGGCQMLTLSPYNHWLKKLLRARSDNKLSAAAMETLAIIAYKQPVIRADIEVIRGVAAGEVIRSLAYKGLVKIVGRAEVLGRPMLYGTTKKFLEVFGLNSLKDLPKVEELKRPPS
jgi:segregation and condensation protein B